MRGPPLNPEDTTTTKALIKMGPEMKDFVDQLVKEYLHDANVKRLMWTTGVVKEIPLGRVRSVKLKISSGSIVTREVQCLHPN